jgi:DNA-binding PadR family transcriptional regulator
MGRQLGYATVAILRAIRNGYEYGTDIMERTGLPSGTVYPTLSRLDERGFLRSRWERRELADAERRPRRRYYRLTAPGDRALDAAIRRLAVLTDDTTAHSRAEAVLRDDAAPEGAR